MFILIFIAVVCIFLAYVYISENKKANYWTKKGVQQVKHNMILGVLWDYAVKDGTLAHVFKDIYDKFPKEPYVGGFSGSNKILILRDPKLFQYVLRTEFQDFHSRGVNVNWEVDKLADNVLFMEGTRWKLMRQRLTPVFTSGKLRNIFPIINDSGKQFENFIEEMCKEGHKHSLMNIITTFTASSIGASVFGINANPGTDFDSPLHKMARESNNPTVITNIKFFVAGIFPNLFRLMKIKIFGDHENFFLSFVKHVLKNRKEGGVKRHDFIDNCLDIQREEKLCDPVSGYEMETTDELMAGQAFFFFIAGVDPTATAINFALYELAKNPDILETLHREVDNVFAEHEELTYEIVNDMKYIEKVINESLRMYPPIGNIQRKCTVDHVMPNGLKIEKDVVVAIPILAVHRDPKIYPKPEVFDPERFCSEIEKERPNYTFLPFGEGNRLCIGMRYAKLQMKTGLIHLLRKFTVRLLADGNVSASREPIYTKSFFSLRAEHLGYMFVPRKA